MHGFLVVNRSHKQTEAKKAASLSCEIFLALVKQNRPTKTHPEIIVSSNRDKKMLVKQIVSTACMCSNEVVSVTIFGRSCIARVVEDVRGSFKKRCRGRKSTGIEKTFEAELEPCLLNSATWVMGRMTDKRTIRYHSDVYFQYTVKGVV